MSAILGSPLGRVPFVRSEAASEGLPLMVENRFEFRFCSRLGLRGPQERIEKLCDGQSGCRGRGRGGGIPTD